MTSDRTDWLITRSALKLVQAMGQSHASVPLWFVTRGAQPVLGTVSNPRHAGLWGLASVVAAEYADVACHVVDLDPSPTSADLDVLVGELTRPHADWHAHRGSRDVPIRTSTRALDIGPA